MEYYQDKTQWKMPKRIAGASKRGIWQINVGDAKSFKTDNGVVYTPEDF